MVPQWFKSVQQFLTFSVHNIPQTCYYITRWLIETIKKITIPIMRNLAHMIAYGTLNAAILLLPHYPKYSWNSTRGKFDRLYHLFGNIYHNNKTIALSSFIMKTLYWHHRLHTITWCMFSRPLPYQRMIDWWRQLVQYWLNSFTIPVLQEKGSLLLLEYYIVI